MEKLKRHSPGQLLIYIPAREVLQSPTAGMWGFFKKSEIR